MRTWKLGWTVFVLWVGIGTSAPAVAQQTTARQIDLGFLTEQMQRETQRQAALAAIAADRMTAVNDIILAHAEEANALYGEGWRSELTDALMAATPQQLLDARSARTYRDVVNVLTGQRTTTSSTGTLALGVAPQSLGSSSSDLVYFPVAPCRLLDTRAAGGVFVNATTRSYKVNGDMTAQGGSASGCGIPVDPSAVAITLTVTQTVGVGYLSAYAFTDPVPGASTINFSNGSELANTTIVPVCQLCGGGSDISITAGTTGSTHVVADIVGYFWSPTATALDVVSSNSALTPVASSGLPFIIQAPACPAGTVITGGGYAADKTVKWLAVGEYTGVWQCAGINDTGQVANIACQARCAKVPGR
jgi:hypothetical protein